MNVVAVELVIAGAWFTVRVKAWGAAGTWPFDAISHTENVPPAPAGVPVMKAVLLALVGFEVAVNAIPEGSAPTSEIVGAG